MKDNRIIATIRLAPGEVGYYDELTKIYLTMSQPKANIYAYMNTSNILRSIRAKTIILVSGSLITRNVKEVNEENLVKRQGPILAKEPKKEIVEVNQDFKINDDSIVVEKENSLINTELEKEILHTVITPDVEENSVELNNNEDIAVVVEEVKEEPKKTTRKTRKKVKISED